jgi:hypothetical protein
MHLEDNPQLAAMIEILGRIEALLAATPKTRRPKPKGAQRHAEMIAEARERDADPQPIEVVLREWSSLCPDHPQLVAPIPLARRQIIRAFVSDMQNDVANVRALFETIAADDWLSGRLVGRKGSQYSRPRGAVGLFEAIKNASAILEGEYK